MPDDKPYVVAIELEVTNAKPPDDDEYDIWGVDADFNLEFAGIAQQFKFPLIRGCELVKTSRVDIAERLPIIQAILRMGALQYGIVPHNRDTARLRFGVTFVLSDGDRFTIPCAPETRHMVDFRVTRPA